MKKILKTLFIMILLFMLFSCNNTKETKVINAKESYVLNWNISYMPRDFYPSINLTDTEKQIVNQLYEGLMVSHDGELEYGMAESVKISLDGLAYTFKLRNAQWSDSVLITSDDFIYSWERSQNYCNDVNLLYYDSQIDYVEAIGERHLKIVLKYPNSNLLNELSTIPFMPLRRDIIDLEKPLPNFMADITNGPYVLESNSIYSKLKLKKNIHYYDYFDVHIQEIDIYLSSNYFDAYSKFNKGEYDVVQSVSHEHIQRLIQNDSNFHLFNKNAIYNFTFNVEKDYLKIKEIRQILNLAIDRSEINPFSSIINNTTSFSIISSDMKDILRAGSDLEFDLIKELDNFSITQSYSEADKIKGLKEKIDDDILDKLNGMSIITLNTPNDIKVANMLKEMWKENLNINLEVKVKDQYDYNYALKSKSYDIILNEYYYDKNNIRSLLKSFLSNPNINKYGYKDETYDSKIMKAFDYDNKSLNTMFVNLIGDIDDASVNIPLYKIYSPVLVNSNVEGWTRSYESLFYFGRASIVESNK